MVSHSYTLCKSDVTHKLISIEGPISSVEVFGSTLIIVNDRDVAFELMDRRSATYSDRPVLTFGGEMCVKLLESPLMHEY